MSNARSPREVCSTTIGMLGLIRCSFRERVPSGRWWLGRGRPRQGGRSGARGGAAGSRRAPGRPQLRRLGGLGLVLVRRPDRLARLGQLRRDRLDLGGDPVDRLLHAQVVADAVGAAGLDELLDVLLFLALLAKLLADVVVRD